MSAARPRTARGHASGQARRGGGGRAGGASEPSGRGALGAIIVGARDLCTGRTREEGSRARASACARGPCPPGSAAPRSPARAAPAAPQCAGAAARAARRRGVGSRAAWRRGCGRLSHSWTETSSTASRMSPRRTLVCRARPATREPAARLGCCASQPPRAGAMVACAGAGHACAATRPEASSASMIQKPLRQARGAQRPGRRRSARGREGTGARRMGKA